MSPRIGVISDTHGLLRPEALEALAGVELILHAGDVGGPEVLDGLRRVAPVEAIRGNVDTSAWALASLRPTALVEHAGLAFYLIHHLADLDLDPRAAGVAAVISGHSHQPALDWRGDVLYLNPGSAGPPRFRLPTTVALVEVAAGRIAEVRLRRLPA